MGTTLLRIILSIIFICWGVYVILIAINTNRKAFNKEDGMSPNEWRKKLRKSHLKKVFSGLLVVLIIVLILIFVESKLD